MGHKQESFESIIKIRENLQDESRKKEISPKVLLLDIFRPVVYLRRLEELTSSKKVTEPHAVSQPRRDETSNNDCEACGEIFGSKMDLWRHTLRMHYENETHECFCGAISPRKDSLVRHRKNIHRLKSQICRVCKCIFKSQADLKKHCELLHRNKHKLMVSDHKQQEMNPSKLNRAPRKRKLHAIKIHNGKNTKNVMKLNKSGLFICDRCGAYIKLFPSMVDHWKRHLKPRQYQCDLCPKAYNRKCNLSDHMEVAHICDKKYECKKCDFKAASNPHVKRHMIHHELKKECPRCKKLVKNLSRHSKRHLKEKYLKMCDQCDEPAFNHEDLKKHKLKCHYDGKLFKCHCGSLFKTEKLLSLHQKGAHVTVNINCEACGGNFKKLHSFKSHWSKKHSKTHGPKPRKVENTRQALPTDDESFFRKLSESLKIWKNFVQ